VRENPEIILHEQTIDGREQVVGVLAQLPRGVIEVAQQKIGERDVDPAPQEIKSPTHVVGSGLLEELVAQDVGAELHQVLALDSGHGVHPLEVVDRPLEGSTVAPVIPKSPL